MGMTEEWWVQERTRPTGLLLNLQPRETVNGFVERIERITRLPINGWWFGHSHKMAPDGKRILPDYALLRLIVTSTEIYEIFCTKQIYCTF